MAKDFETKKSGTGKVVMLVTLLIIAGLVAAAGYFFMKNRDLKQKNSSLQAQNSDLTKQLAAYKTDPSQAAQAEADTTIAEVGKLYDLPADEKPIVGKVADVDKLPKDQPFFAKAAKNDITLIYSKAKLGILYRPSTKQIINVSSVTIQDQAPAASPTP